MDKIQVPNNHFGRKIGAMYYKDKSIDFALYAYKVKKDCIFGDNRLKRLNSLDTFEVFKKDGRIVTTLGGGDDINLVEELFDNLTLVLACSFICLKKKLFKKKEVEKKFFSKIIRWSLYMVDSCLERFEHLIDTHSNLRRAAKTLQYGYEEMFIHNTEYENSDIHTWDKQKFNPFMKKLLQPTYYKYTKFLKCRELTALSAFKPSNG